MLNLPGARDPYQAMPYRPKLPPTFANGGHVNAMREIAEMLRHHGEGEDKILAHINIDEARQLGKQHGFSGHNPHTGLPQFGGDKKRRGFRRLARALKPLQRVVAPFLNPKQAYKDIRKHGPIIGSIIGTALGGPLGGIAGGGLGGLISSRKNGAGRTKPFSNALRGAGQGAMIGTAGHFLTGGNMGNIPGMGGGAGPAASGGSGLGDVFSKIGGFGSDIGSKIGGIFGMGGNQGPGAEPAGDQIPSGKNSGFLGDLAGKLGLSIPQLALAGVMGYGMLKGKAKQQPREGIENLPKHLRPREYGEREKVVFGRPYYIEPPEGYSPDTEGQEHQYVGYGDPMRNFAHGGEVSETGYVHGRNPGQLDDVDIKLEPNSYVIDASTLSDVGDGNSLAGDEVIERMLQKVSHFKPKRKSYAKGGALIDARVSAGEKIIPKEKVVALGKGSSKKGIAKLNSMVKKVRTLKRGSSKLPPAISHKVSGMMGGR